MEGGTAKDELAPAGEPGLSPEDEAHIFDAFDASFKDDFEGGSHVRPFSEEEALRVRGVWAPLQAQDGPGTGRATSACTAARGPLRAASAGRPSTAARIS